MGGSSKQVIGYNYFAGLQVVIGNCIEQIININPDNRGWIFTKPEELNQLKIGDTSMTVLKGDIFGGEKGEGGWSGIIDIHTGREEYLRQNDYLAAQDSELVSSFPNLSYLVFRGFKANTTEPATDQGFFLCAMSGMLKEVLYWPKRIHIKDNGALQWYDEKAEILDGEFIIVEPHDFTFLASRGNNGVITTQTISYNANLKTFSPNKSGGGEGGSSQNPFTGYHEETQSFTNTSPYKIKIRVESTTVGASTSGDKNYIKIVAPLESFSEIAWCSNSKYNPSTNQHVMGASLDIFFLEIQPADDDRVGLDLNVIHKIREIITDDTAMNKPESMINDVNFMAAADRIFDESLGVSGAFTEKSCKEAIDELLFHIEAGIRLNRQTGQYEIVLFRDDLLNLSIAPVFNKSNIKSFNIEIANVDDVINSVNVNYYDRQNIKSSSFSLDEIGSVLSSEVNAQTLDFPYFMNRRNAELVGNWKLKQLSTPTRKGTFTTGKYEARKINKYDVVKLTWANQNMNEVPVRIMKIGLGDGRDNTVSLDWVEVIPYSSTIFPTINVDPPTSVVLPPQPNQSVVFEMPYFEAVQRFGQTQVDAELANNPDLGYLVVATKKPQNNSINALLYTDDESGYQQASIVDYCPVATLDQNIGYLNSSFAVKNVASISQAEVGTLILCDEELMVYQSYDASTKILTVKRAALDTVPKPHSQDAVFYFYDAFNAFDSEQYVLNEVIHAKVLTTTPSGILDINEASVMSLEMNARPNRPYPPANVKINSEYYPEEIETDLVVTWVDRNRLQQTGGSILGWTDGGVALEGGAATMLVIKELNGANVVIATHNVNATGTSSYTLPIASMQADTVKLEVSAKTTRDGYESYQYFKHTVELSTFFSAPYDIHYTVR
ncbi:phage tail protein [Acinetobacter sp. NIPH1876]|uniref:phage tail protein n=1 Tax=Acinetobacter sp. NIPH1876 TaxID=2924041 RepID=UPI001FAB61D3|nr:phage tail protein [Acinetobacter sp. NIPH1876]MCJ0828712.1 phage tail protein [Acinetobacter sp. NIPH1876]